MLSIREHSTLNLNPSIADVVAVLEDAVRRLSLSVEVFHSLEERLDGGQVLLSGIFARKIKNAGAWVAVDFLESGVAGLAHLGGAASDAETEVVFKMTLGDALNLAGEQLLRDV